MREILWKGDKVGIIVSTTYRLVRTQKFGMSVYFRKDELYNRMALTKNFLQITNFVVSLCKFYFLMIPEEKI
jgi:hypothetical protein